MIDLLPRIARWGSVDLEEWDLVELELVELDWVGLEELVDLEDLVAED